MPKIVNNPIDYSNVITEGRSSRGSKKRHAESSAEMLRKHPHLKIEELKTQKQLDQRSVNKFMHEDLRVKRAAEMNERVAAEIEAREEIQKIIEEITGYQACLSDSNVTNETFLARGNEKRTAYVELLKQKCSRALALPTEEIYISKSMENMQKEKKADSVKNLQAEINRILNEMRSCLQCSQQCLKQVFTEVEQYYLDVQNVHTQEKVSCLKKHIPILQTLHDRS